MLTQLAALGIGLITTVASPIVHAAQPGCDPAHPTAGYPPHRAPAPTYAPAAPPRYQAPPVRHVEASPVVMRRADYNRDGGVTLQEARAYGRNQFIRADRDRNGVLTRRERNNADGELSRVSGNRGGGLTLAEYHASITSEFHSLDRNRDAFLSRRELRTASPDQVAYGRNRSL